MELILALPPSGTTDEAFLREVDEEYRRDQAMQVFQRYGRWIIGAVVVALVALGGYGARGKSNEEHARILDDARAVAEAGAFAIVAEGVVEGLANEITAAVPVPVIGIGASAQCDGQVLVTEDMLGMFERVPRFVRRYEELAETIAGAAERYAADVRARTFPGSEQTYQPRKS